MAESTQHHVVRLVPIWRSRLPVTPGVGLIVLPLIDVLFLLLIFLMIGSSLVFHHGVPVEVPEVVSPSKGTGYKLVITYTKDKQLYFNDTLISGWAALENALTTVVNDGAQKPIIILRADRSATHEDVMMIESITRPRCSRLFIVTKGKEGE